MDLPTEYPSLSLRPDLLEKLVEDEHDWCHANGLVLRQNGSDALLCRSCPFTVLPTPFPREHYYQAVDVAKDMAILYHRISYDFDFIFNTHVNVADPFIQKLLYLYENTMRPGMLTVRSGCTEISVKPLVQKTSLTIQRADYMLHQASKNVPIYKLKQVEVNNMASGMYDFGQKANQMHRFILGRMGYGQKTIDNHLPQQDDEHIIGKSLFEAWKMMESPKHMNGILLIIVEESNMNQLDQRHVEYAAARYGVPLPLIKRATLTECFEKLTIGSNQELCFGEEYVNVIYFRAGYKIEHYPTDKEWSARYLMEISSAIKAPWVGLQLANTKMCQQALAQQGIVEKYLYAENARKVRNTFGQMWNLMDEKGISKVVKDAINSPEKYVLKPQREGGQGNYYDKELKKLLEYDLEDVKASCILMEKFIPPIRTNYISSSHSVARCPVVSELGIFATCLGEPIEEKAAVGGCLFRTKATTTYEGGIHSGSGAIDTPYLYP